MNEETRTRCLAHLREASVCLEGTRHTVIAVRLQDLIEAVEADTAPGVGPATSASPHLDEVASR